MKNSRVAGQRPNGRAAREWAQRVRNAGVGPVAQRIYGRRWSRQGAAAWQGPAREATKMDEGLAARGLPSRWRWDLASPATSRESGCWTTTRRMWLSVDDVQELGVDELVGEQRQQWGANSGPKNSQHGCRCYTHAQGERMRWGLCRRGAAETGESWMLEEERQSKGSHQSRHPRIARRHPRREGRDQPGSARRRARSGSPDAEEWTRLPKPGSMSGGDARDSDDARDARGGCRAGDRGHEGRGEPGKSDVNRGMGWGTAREMRRRGAHPGSQREATARERRN